ncbi:MAG: hypothetical protein VXZ82_20805 [Planctomycetota bacterium]|nr:hypothetical protein [Planctomycetota bacterium]
MYKQVVAAAIVFSLICCGICSAQTKEESFLDKIGSSLKSPFQNVFSKGTKSKTYDGTCDGSGTCTHCGQSRIVTPPPSSQSMTASQPTRAPLPTVTRKTLPAHPAGATQFAQANVNVAQGLPGTRFASATGESQLRTSLVPAQAIQERIADRGAELNITDGNSPNWSDYGGTPARPSQPNVPNALPPNPTPEAMHAGDSSVVGADLTTAKGLGPVESAVVQEPRIGGRHLKQGQVTATEHALRLSRELKELQANLESMRKYNEQLEKRFMERMETSREMEAAIANAKNALTESAQENQRLRGDLAKLSREHTLYKQKAARLLEQIKSELDDQLVRQIMTEKKP